MEHSTKPDSIPLNDKSHSTNLPSVADFDKMLTEYLLDNMGIKIPESNKQLNGAISRLFPGFHPDVYSLGEAETMWGLVQDEEYVLSRYSHLHNVLLCDLICLFLCCYYHHKVGKVSEGRPQSLTKPFSESDVLERTGKNSAL